MMEEREIEADVVTQDRRPAENPQHGWQLIAEPRLPRDHLLRDPCKGRHAGAYPSLGVDELLIAGDLPAVLNPYDLDLDDLVPISGRRTGGFGIDDRDGQIAKRM